MDRLLTLQAVYKICDTFREAVAIRFWTNYVIL